MDSMNPLNPRWRQTGLTLIELVIFIIVVSVGLVGVLSVLNITARSSADPMIRKQALAVAEAMMEEILSKDYQNDAADSGNTSAALGCTPNTVPACAANTVLNRTNYNDVDDYNGWNQVGVFQVDGTAAPILGTYTVQVRVAALTLSGITGKQVMVTVTGGTETITLNGFRANF
ncbi:MAG: type II secretion system protein [Propionivibrio sp.]